MYFTIFVSLLLLLCLWEYIVKKHRNDVLRKSKIEGTFSLPLIGGAYIFRGRNSENSVDRLRASVLARNKTSYTWIFGQLTVMIADPRDLEALLTSPIHITKNNVYDMLSDWLGNGLLMSTGKKWHMRRKIITPTFHFKILEQFVEVFDRQSDTLVQLLKIKANSKTVVNIFPYICLTALDIIAESAMGVKINSQMQPNLGYAKSVKKVIDLIAERLRTPIWRFELPFRLLAASQYKSMLEHINVMQSFTNNVIQQRRETLQDSLTAQSQHQSTKEHDPENIGSKTRMALLDVLLQATTADGKPLSNEDIREEVETFMFAGHDTTTSAISFCLYLISRHPEVQAQLFQEIRDVIGDDRKKPVSMRELQEFKYMELVIKESLRMFPPVPVIGRYFSEDVPINDRVIPGKTHVYMPLFVVLRDPDFFPEPDAFKPERFAAGNYEKINPFAYTPFSAGPRNCIGQKFALLEMKSIISKIMRNYELLPLGPDVVPSLSLIMNSATGMNMGLKLRTYH